MQQLIRATFWGAASALLVLCGLGCAATQSSSSAHESTATSVTRQRHIELRLPDFPAAFTAEEQAAYRGLQSGAESPELLLRAAFLASGILDGAQLASYEKTARQRFEAIRPTVEAEADPVRRIARLLAEMHRTIFREYVVEQTYLPEIFDLGYFNCVSSAVLFNVYAGWLGFATQGAILPTHAYSVALTGGRWIEVQTTSPFGLEGLNSPEAWHRFVVARGLTGSEGRVAQRVPSRVLIMHILMNRIGLDHDAVTNVMQQSAPTNSLDAQRSEAFLRNLVAISRRMLVLAPEDRGATEVQSALLSRLAGRLVLTHPDEAWELARLVLQIESGLAGSEATLQIAQRNLAIAAAHRLQQAATGEDVARVESITTEARALLGCAAPNGCALLDDQAEIGLWNGIIELEKSHGMERAWRVADAAMRLYPRGANVNDLVNSRVMVGREAQRRFDIGDHLGVERFVREQLGRIVCEPRPCDGCAALATLATAAAWDEESARALDWARLAFGYDWTNPLYRANYSKAALNLAVALFNSSGGDKGCARLARLHDEIAAVPLDAGAVGKLLDECRARR